MTKLPPRSLKKDHQDAISRLKQYLSKDHQPENDNAIADPTNLDQHTHIIPDLIPENDNQINSKEYHTSDLLSSDRISTEYRTDQDSAKISHSGRGLLRWGEYVHGIDVERIRRALEKVVRGHGACGEDTCAHCRQFIGVPKSVSDLAVVAFLLTLAPDMVSAWTSELEGKLRRYATWPTANFVIADRERRVRLVVRNRTLATVTPFPRVSPQR